MKIGCHFEGTKCLRNLIVQADGNSSPSAQNNGMLEVFYFHTKIINKKGVKNG
jgi:hypothetical protein